MMAQRTKLVLEYLKKLSAPAMRDLMIEIVESLDEQQFRIIMDCVLTELDRRHPKGPYGASASGD